MLNAISLKPYLIPSNTRPPKSIEGECRLEDTDEVYRYQITICFEGRCAFQGALYAHDQVRTCRVELQFPLFSKIRVNQIQKKNSFQVSLRQSTAKDELILLLFCEKLMKDARKYITFLNQENFLESYHPSSVNLETSCPLEDREIKQQFLLFLIRCSGRNRNEKEPYFREFSAQVLRDPPYASINAMAILIKMQYSFYNEDLQGVNLSQANLEGAMLYGAKLNGGNLEKTRLHNACLHNADLSEARMSQVDTGRRPSILTSSTITCWDTSPNEHLLAVATRTDGLSIWNLEKSVSSTCISTDIILEKHLKCSNPDLSIYSQIDCVKFINDQRILVLDSLGFLGLWSVDGLTLLSSNPTILTVSSLSRLPQNVRDEILEIYKDTLSFHLPSPSSLNQYCCLKGSILLQEGLNNTFHFLFSAHNRDDLTYLKLNSKLIIQTSKIVQNRIKISGKRFPSSLKIGTDDSHELGVYVYGNCKAFSCLSPSGWVALLPNDGEEGRIILELKSQKSSQEVSFLSKERIDKLNFTPNDLWLIGLIKTPSTSKLVKWRTDRIYPPTGQSQDILPIPTYQELFQINGDMEKFDLLLNKPYCIYTVGSDIYVRNLITNKIIYHVEINPPYTFKLLSQQGLLLTVQSQKFHVEVHKINLLISDFPEPTYKGSKCTFFSPDNRYLITRPSNKSLYDCLEKKEALLSIACDIKPNLMNLQNCLGRLSYYEDFERCFYSPLLKYAVFMNTNTLCLWNLEKGQCVHQFEVSSGPWGQLQKDFLDKKTSPTKGFLYQITLNLSDDLFLAMTHGEYMVVTDVRDPQSPQNVLEIKVSDMTMQIKLSKNTAYPKTFFYTSKNEIIRQECSKKNTKLYFKGHTHWVATFDTSYDNRLLLSSGIDYTIRLWDTSLGKQLDCVRTLGFHSDLMFAPNNRFITSYSKPEDRTYLWEVRDSILKLLSIFPKELGCRRANFENATGMDKDSKKLFEQLGGLNITDKAS